MTKGVHQISNKEYHGEKEHLSSSNLKSLLEDPQVFYTEKILGVKENESKPQYEEGSLVHSMILEPNLVDVEYSFFNGKVKRGADFEKFKQENPDKTIISKTQLERCADFVNAYHKRPEASGLIRGGAPELSIFSTYNDVNVKARFDYINVNAGYILDIKTTGYSADPESFKMTIRDFKYDLSAAFYLKIAEEFYQKKFDFYFVVISKSDLECEVYRLSDRSRINGQKQVDEAITIYKRCIATGVWESEAKKKNEGVYTILDI